MSERRKLAANELGKLHLYQGFMSYQLSWCLAYAALFATVELGVLFLATQLKKIESIANLVMIGIAGLVVGLGILWFYHLSAREMDRWKDKILELTELTDVEEEFEHWRSRWYRWNKATRGGMRLLWILPLFVPLVWAWLQLVF